MKKAAVSMPYGTAAYELHVSCDFKNFVLAGQSIRHLDRDDLILCRADECAAERRFVGDLPLQAVSFCGADDSEFEFIIILDVMDPDLAADVDRVRACLFLNEDFRVLQDFFNLLDTRLDVSLLVLGSIIFSVLGKVALLAGLFNFLGNCLSLIDLQIRKGRPARGPL